MVRCLRVARATAVKARTQAANALRALVVTAPAELRQQLRELSAKRLASTAARLRPGPILTTTAATKLALRLLGQRYQALEAELAAVDAELDRLTAQAAPRLRQRCGVGPEIAGALLVAAGDNPERLRSEAAFSMLCGACPILASSGKTVRRSRRTRSSSTRATTGGDPDRNRSITSAADISACDSAVAHDASVRPGIEPPPATDSVATASTFSFPFPDRSRVAASALARRSISSDEASAKRHSGSDASFALR